MYPVATHETSSIDAPKLPAIVSSATFTIVASMMAIISPSITVIVMRATFVSRWVVVAVATAIRPILGTRAGSILHFAREAGAKKSEGGVTNGQSARSSRRSVCNVDLADNRSILGAFGN